MATTEEPDNWDDLAEPTRSDITVDSENETHRLAVDVERDGELVTVGLEVTTQDASYSKLLSVSSDAYTEDQDGNVDLDLEQYYNDVLEYIIVDINIEYSNIRMLLKQLSPESGRKIRSLAPDPNEIVGDAEEKNLERPSVDG